MQNNQVDNQIGESTGCSKMCWLLIVIGALWVFGIIFVEYLYYYTRRLRMLDPQLKEKYRAIANEPEKWNKLVFYLCMLLNHYTLFSHNYPNLGSVLIIPRTILFVSISFILAITTKLMILGTPSNRPLSGWRKAIAKFAGQLITRIGLFIQSFLWITNKQENTDYSEWLGPDYKAQASTKRAPIIIANHQSWSVISERHLIIY